MENKTPGILSGMILSVSGWRGIFANNAVINDTDNTDSASIADVDINEESFSQEISHERKLFAAASAFVFSKYLKKFNRKGDVIVARDTRPTGAAIADAVIRVLSAEGRGVRWLDVCAAPEIMAYAKSSGSENEKNPVIENSDKKNPAAGFIYISASHNPIGHNGIKFGLTDGGVLPGSEAAVLINDIKYFLSLPDSVSRLEKMLEKTDDGLKSKAAFFKTEALKAYETFSREVITDYSDKQKADNVFAIIQQGLKKYPLGICADFNGSARTVSIDREFIESLGIKFKSINDKPGEIKHRIVPEGESLDPCREFLEKSNSENPEFLIGYVPDCDGDRGNLTVCDNGKFRPVEAQEVFSISCAAELAYFVWTGQLKYDSSGKAVVKAALAVNDPTSLRIDKIAKAFDVTVFRAEVGEANVVSLARKLRSEGYIVRILGEGSNGGNITHPAAVRDPLNTLAAFMKFLAIRSGNSGKGLFEIWCGRSGQAEKYKPDFTLADIIASIPAFRTTGSVSKDGLLSVTTADHGLLKDRYQKIFLKDWEEKKSGLRDKYGISGWEAVAYNGITEKRVTRFGEAGRGGLKILFRDSNDHKIACLWMRGSGTEPVFRVMADAEGADSGFEQELIEWQRTMVTEADKA